MKRKSIFITALIIIQALISITANFNEDSGNEILLEKSESELPQHPHTIILNTTNLPESLQQTQSNVIEEFDIISDTALTERVVLDEKDLAATNDSSETVVVENEIVLVDKKANIVEKEDDESLSKEEKQTLLTTEKESTDILRSDSLPIMETELAEIVERQSAVIALKELATVTVREQTTLAETELAVITGSELAKGTESESELVKAVENEPAVVVEGDTNFAEKVMLVKEEASDVYYKDEIILVEDSELYTNAKSESVGDFVAVALDVDDDDDDDRHEDDVMKEILEMQQRENDAQMEENKEIKNDQLEALEAERAAKLLEAAQVLEELKWKREDQASKAAAKDAWIRRSRPGVEAKPGAKLAQTAASSTAGSTNRDSIDGRTSRAGRDRVPESLLRETGKVKGNYFGGSSAADKEVEMRRKETQRQAAEKDKISSGAGDRRREIEAMLSPNMRAQVAAEQQRILEEEQVRSARRVRASVPRRYARPVERTLSVYNSHSTDLYDVLRVAKGVDETSLKKAYRAAALSVHPDKNVHPDSKIAFDSVQEAFETLSSPLKRESYNSEQRKRKGRHSLKRVMWYLTGEYKNIKSRSQLFWVRVFKRGEAILEYQELVGDRLTSIKTSLHHIAEHIVLLPTAFDRIRLVSELSFDGRNKLLLGALLISIFLG